MSVLSRCRSLFSKKSRRGAILLVAVGAITTLSILALGVSSGVMQELRLARYLTEESADFLSAVSTVEILTFALRGDTTPEAVTFYDLRPKTVVLGDRTLTINFVDESRFVDLMSASADVLGRLPGLAGDTELVKKLEAADLNFIEEVPSIDGMTPGLFETIKPYVTVSRQVGVNVNTASAEVLAALGMDTDLVERILVFRNGPDGQEGTADDGVFPRPDEIMKTLQEEPLSVSQQELLLTLVTSGQLITKSNRVRYLISSAKGRTVHEYEAVIYVPTVGIISWEDKGVPTAPQRGTWS